MLSSHSDMSLSHAHACRTYTQVQSWRLLDVKEWHLAQPVGCYRARRSSLIVPSEARRSRDAPHHAPELRPDITRSSRERTAETHAAHLKRLLWTILGHEPYAVWPPHLPSKVRLVLRRMRDDSRVSNHVSTTLIPARLCTKSRTKSSSCAVHGPCR